MKKTLLAVAIPALLASGAASATTLYDNNGTKVDIKGSLRIALTYSDARDGAGEDGTKFKDVGSRFGFKVTHDLGDGLYGLGELEYGNDTQQNESNFKLKNRLGYVGLGLQGVGEFTFGRVLSPFDDVAMSDYTYDYGGILDFGHGVSKGSTDKITSRTSNTAKFMSADFDGFSFGTTYTTQAEFDDFGNTETKIRNGYSFSGFYDSGFGLKINAGYVNAKVDKFDDRKVDLWGASAEYTVDALSVAFDLGRSQDKNGSVKTKAMLYGVGAKYNLGKANVYAGYYLSDANNKSEIKEEHTIVVGTDYQFTPSVRTFVEYANVEVKHRNGLTSADSDYKDENKAMVGMRVYF